MWFGLPTLFFGPKSSWSPWPGLISAPAALILGWAIRRGYRLARAGCLIWWVVMTADIIVA